jgi:hypothetical protein
MAHQIDSAQSAYKIALELAQKSGTKRQEGIIIWNMAVLQWEMGQTKRAMSLAQQASSVFQQLNDPYQETVERHLVIWQAN